MTLLAMLPNLRTNNLNGLGATLTLDHKHQRLDRREPFGRSCLASGNFTMKLPASRKVRSSRPSGRGIGSSKRGTSRCRTSVGAVHRQTLPVLHLSILYLDLSP